MPLSEADTCRKYVVPKLQAAGWDDDPYSIAEQRSITDGRIVPVGKGFVRKPPKRVDYLLRYERNFPLAVVEAKAAWKTAGDGMQQAKEYAETLGLKFAYATNGGEIIEFDYFTGKEMPVSIFPTPGDLPEQLVGEHPREGTPDYRDRREDQGALGEAVMKRKTNQPRVVREASAGYGDEAIVIYQSPDGIRVDVKLDRETVWLPQKQIAQLLDTERSVVTKHLRNIFKSGELIEDSVSANFAQTAADGKTYQMALGASLWLWFLEKNGALYSRTLLRYSVAASLTRRSMRIHRRAG